MKFYTTTPSSMLCLIKCIRILNFSSDTQSFVFLTILISLNPLSFGEEGRPPVQEEVHKDTSEGKPKALQFQVLNRTAVEMECKLFVRWWSRDRDFWICASDDRVYRNPGVLLCSQTCNPCYL